MAKIIISSRDQKFFITWILQNGPFFEHTPNLTESSKNEFYWSANRKAAFSCSHIRYLFRILELEEFLKVNLMQIITPISILGISALATFSLHLAISALLSCLYWSPTGSSPTEHYWPFQNESLSMSHKNEIKIVHQTWYDSESHQNTRSNT